MNSCPTCLRLFIHWGRRLPSMATLPPPRKRGLDFLRSKKILRWPRRRISGWPVFIASRESRKPPSMKCRNSESCKRIPIRRDDPVTSTAYGESSGLLCRLQLLQIGQDFLAVPLRPDLEINLSDHARGIDQECVPCRQRHSVIFHDRAVLLHHGVSRIGEQLEIQALFGAKALMRIHVVHADADDCRILLRVLIDVALEIVSFDGAS